MKTFLFFLVLFLCVFAAPFPLLYGQPPSTQTTVYTIRGASAGTSTVQYSYSFRDSESGLWSTESFTTIGALGPGDTHPLSLTIDADTRYKIYQLGNVEAIGPSFKASSSETLRLIVQLDWETYVAPAVTLQLSNVTPQADGTKPVWVSDGSTLDGQIYREGVDKIVGALSSSSSGGSGGSGGSSTTTDALLEEIIDNQNRDSLPLYHAANGTGVTAATDSLTAAATLQSANVVSAFGNASVTRGTGVAAVTPAGDSVELGFFSVVGPFAEQLSAGFKPLAFEGPYSAFAYASTKILAYGLIVREMLLWLTVFAFWYFARDLMEKYYIGFMNTPQMTTKVETAQIAVPGVGWGKQLVTVLTIYTVLLVAIGGTIAAMNTGLGNIFAGQTLADTTGGLINIYSALSGSFAGDTILPFFERFVPLAAMVECAIAQMVLSFGMPIVWAACMTIAKVFHL